MTEIGSRVLVYPRITALTRPLKRLGSLSSATGHGSKQGIWNSPRGGLLSAGEYSQIGNPQMHQNLLALVWLHVVAVGYLNFVRSDSLVGPMLTGKKNWAHVPEGITIIFAHPALALLLASSALVAWILL